MDGNKIIANNKVAYHNYFISDIHEAGISLQGSEVKSIRDGGISILGSYIIIENNELYLKNAFIKPFEKASNYIPDSRRNRKLLLNKDEILKYEKKVKEKGFTLVPLKVYLKRGLVKVEIGLGEGKQLHNKKQDMIEKTAKREIDRAMKVNFK
ncbi:MAG: SsrA-binding protein SmpB [Clostridia bacterium]